MTGHVLLVEDDDAVLDVVGRQLQANGLTIRTAGSATEALRAIDNDAYSALIIDRLVASAGLRVSQAFRRRWPHSPIILVTGYTTPHLDMEARAHGVDLVLLKPIHMPQLLAALERLNTAHHAV